MQSVIIPVYNRSVPLRRALQSLVQQTLPRFEVVICDDGSTDNVSTVVEEFREKLNIRSVSILRSGSPARPRNIAIGHANGDWISFLDSDDWWHPSRVEEIEQELSSSVDVVYHKLAVRPKRSKLAWRKRALGTSLGSDPLLDLLTFGNAVPNSAATVRKSSLEKIGGIREFLPLVEDYDLWIRLALAGANFQFLDKILGYYWQGDDNTSLPSQRQLDAFDNTFRDNLLGIPEQQRSMAEAYRFWERSAMQFQMGDAAMALASLEAATGLRTPAQRLKRLVKLLLLKFRVR